MQRLRDHQGTTLHLRAARYHMARCHKTGAPLYDELRNEMSVKYSALKTTMRETEDAEELLVDCAAARDEAETALEDLLRDIDADLGKLDRQNPSLNARSTVFPDGFGAEIDPEGDAQLTILPALLVRLQKFSSHEVVATAVVKLQEAENTFRAALTAQTAAEGSVQTFFEEEREARRDVREQLESAHGRLRDFHKSKPSVAEGFFFRFRTARTKASSQGACPEPETSTGPVTVSAEAPS